MEPIPNQGHEICQGLSAVTRQRGATHPAEVAGSSQDTHTVPIFFPLLVIFLSKVQ